ncbi:DUF6223 family protein [Dactylosporangium salmoneum]|uniref:DUF6223 family protein n=1 Tax=Dactylosporangium salmoneum TaxID=53361 RepID=UPI003CD0C275
MLGQAGDHQHRGHADGDRAVLDPDPRTAHPGTLAARAPRRLVLRQRIRLLRPQYPAGSCHARSSATARPRHRGMPTPARRRTGVRADRITSVQTPWRRGARHVERFPAAGGRRRRVHPDRRPGGGQRGRAGGAGRRVVGGLAVARPGRVGRGGSTAVLAAGIAAAVVGALVLATADGGPGTGNGVVGAGMAVVLGLAAVVLGWLALTRARRTA